MALDEATGKRIKVDIEQPKWDQSTYWGRATHFFTTANPLNVFATPAQLDSAKDIVSKYRKGEHSDKLTVEELWNAKHLYDSAFHPETGEKMFLPGRMSFQVPGGMIITGALLTFYKSTGQVVFWQWFNQSFNAMVNYTNRSGDSPIGPSILATSYVAATGGALATALGLNSLVKHSPPLIGRFVPFCAVAAANCVNIPLMRQLELKNGIPLTTEAGEKIGVSSTTAAVQGISMVTISRIAMASPGMLLLPVFMDKLEKRGILARYPRISAPLQTFVVGIFLTFMTPLCCALFPQNASIKVGGLEKEARDKLVARGYEDADYLYYNKGL